VAFNKVKINKVLSIKIGFFFILFFLSLISKAQIDLIHPIFKLQLNEESFNYNSLYDISSDKKGYIYIACDNGLLEFNNSILKKRKTTNNNIKSDFIGFYRKNDTLEFIFPYNGKLFYKQNSQRINLVKGNYPTVTITIAYSISDSIILFGGYDKFYKYTTLEYNTNTTKIIQKNISFNWFINNYIRHEIVDTSSPNFKHIITKINNCSVNEVAIFNDSLLKIQNNIYLKQHKKWRIIFDASKQNIKGTIRKFMLFENSLYFCVANGDIGLYEYNIKKNSTLKFTSDDINGFCFDNHATLWMVNSNSQILYFPILNKKINQYKFIEKIKIASITPTDYKNSFIIKQKNNEFLFINYLNNKFYINGIANSRDQIIYVKNNQLTTKSITSLPNFLKQFDHTHSTFYKNYFILSNNNVQEEYINQFNYFLPINNFNKKYFYDGKVNHINYLKNKVILSTNNGIKFFNPYSKDIFSHITTNTFIDSSEVKKIMFLNDSYFLLINQNIYKLNNINGKSKVIKTTFKSYENQIKSFSIFKQFIIGICRNEMLVYDTNLNFKFSQKLSNNISEKLIDIEPTNNFLYLYNENSIFSIDSSYFLAYQNKYYINNFNIEYNDKKINNSSKIELIQSNNNSLSFTFDLLKSNIESKYELNFQLIKKNKTILKEGVIENTKLNLRNIPIGEYKINLIANGKIIFTTHFTILRNWNKIIIQFITISIILFLIAYFTYLIVKRKQTIKIFELKKQLHLIEIESKTKLNQLKSHFIFNALAPLQHYIYTENKNSAIDYLNTVSKLIRKMLDHSRSQFILLSSEIKFIDLYLKQQQIEKNYSFEFELTNEVNYLNSKIPSLFIQPILENTILHGFSNTQKGFLKIQFTEFDENIISITITENGNGFDLNNQILKRNNNALNIINERILILKQLPKFSKVDIESLKTENHFTIILKLPLIR
jgi:hypothetical protein